eukprot:1605065-Rhodomonas_salina.2
MGSKYDVNDNAGLIPLDSVRAGKGIFFDDDDLEHKCLQYTDGSFPEVASFNASLLQVSVRSPMRVHPPRIHK